jgi:hypothetical protein
MVLVAVLGIVLAAISGTTAACNPTDVRTRPDGSVVVSNGVNFYHFSDDLKLLGYLTWPGPIGGDNPRPRPHYAVDTDGALYVMGISPQRIPHRGNRTAPEVPFRGAIRTVSGIAANAQGDVFVASLYPTRVLVGRLNNDGSISFSRTIHMPLPSTGTLLSIAATPDGGFCVAIEGQADRDQVVRCYDHPFISGNPDWAQPSSAVPNDAIVGLTVSSSGDLVEMTPRNDVYFVRRLGRNGATVRRASLGREEYASGRSVAVSGAALIVSNLSAGYVAAYAQKSLRRLWKIDVGQPYSGPWSLASYGRDLFIAESPPGPGGSGPTPGLDVAHYRLNGDRVPARLTSISGSEFYFEPGPLAFAGKGTLLIDQYFSRIGSFTSILAIGDVLTGQPMRRPGYEDRALNEEELIGITTAGKLYTSGYDRSVHRYASHAPFGSRPIETIDGRTQDASAYTNLAVDDKGNAFRTDPSRNAIVVTSAGRDINSPHTYEIAGAATGLDQPWGLALASDGTLYVANRGAGDVLVFAPRARGDASPIRRIVVTQSGIEQPTGVSLATNDRVYVTDGPVAETPPALASFTSSVDEFVQKDGTFERAHAATFPAACHILDEASRLPPSKRESPSARSFGDHLTIGMSRDQVEALRKATSGSTTGIGVDDSKLDYGAPITRVWYTSGAVPCVVGGNVFSLIFDEGGRLSNWLNSDWADGC